MHTDAPLTSTGQPRMTLGRHYTLGLVVLLAVLGFIFARLLNT
jgi:hypothetical protein